MRRAPRDPFALAQQLVAALAQQQGEPAANDDDEPPIDEQAIRERARKTAERMRRARSA